MTPYQQLAALGATPPEVLSTTKLQAILQILQECADQHGINPAAIFAPGRAPITTRPRQTAMIRLRNELSLTFVMIGQLFGKDHQTVIHALKKSPVARELALSESL